MELKQNYKYLYDYTDATDIIPNTIALRQEIDELIIQRP